jgi:hypothetical protein
MLAAHSLRFFATPLRMRRHTRHLITITHCVACRFLIYALLTHSNTSCASTGCCVEVWIKRTSVVHAALAACIAHRFLITSASSARYIRANIVSELGKTRSLRFKENVKFFENAAPCGGILSAGYPARSSMKPFNIASVSASSICLSVRQRSMRGNRTATPDL